MKSRFIYFIFFASILEAEGAGLFQVFDLIEEVCQEIILKISSYEITKRLLVQILDNSNNEKLLSLTNKAIAEVEKKIEVIFQDLRSYREVQKAVETIVSLEQVKSDTQILTKILQEEIQLQEEEILLLKNNFEKIKNDRRLSKQNSEDLNRE